MKAFSRLPNTVVLRVIKMKINARIVVFRKMSQKLSPKYQSALVIIYLLPLSIYVHPEFYNLHVSYKCNLFPTILIYF